MIFRLFAEKGRRTYCKKILNEHLEFNEIKGVFTSKYFLGFAIESEGIYKTLENDTVTYWQVYEENEELKRKKIKVKDIYLYFLLDDFSKIKTRIKLEWNIVKYAPRGVSYDINYQLNDEYCFFAENDDFIFIEGSFRATTRKYIRNFSILDNITKKNVIFENLILSKKRDNFEIIFENNRKFISMPVVLDENSLLVETVNPNFMGIIN